MPGRAHGVDAAAGVPLSAILSFSATEFLRLGAFPGIKNFC